MTRNSTPQESEFENLYFSIFTKKLHKENAYSSVYTDSHIVISKWSDFCLLWPLGATAEIENNSLSTSSHIFTILVQLQSTLSSALTTLQVKYSSNSAGHRVCTKQCKSHSCPQRASAYCCTRWTSSGEQLVLQNTWFH